MSDVEKAIYTKIVSLMLCLMCYGLTALMTRDVIRAKRRRWYLILAVVAIAVAITFNVYFVLTTIPEEIRMIPWIDEFRGDANPDRYECIREAKGNPWKGRMDEH